MDSNKNKNNLTPLMKQYYDIKNEHPDTLLLFQVGDFYELFFEDAIKASSNLGLALTHRGTDANGHPIPLCGVPTHVLDHYLIKLVKAGFKVAVCDQLETPKAGKIVKRGITQVLTPGTLTDLKLLDEKSASYLCTFFPTIENNILIFAELLTGQLFITSIEDNTSKSIESEILRFMPDEIVIPDTKEAKKYISTFKQFSNVTVESFDILTNNFDTETTILQESKIWFKEQFDQENNNIDNLKNTDAFNYGLATFYKFLKRNNEKALNQIKTLSIYNQEDFLILDAATQKNLELIKNSKDGSSKNTLFSVLDQAVTPMGSRTIKKWITRPLIKKDLIEKRLDSVEFLTQNIIFKENLIKYIQKIGDIERTIGRIALSRAQLHDYILLAQALEFVPLIKQELSTHAIDNKLLSAIGSKISDFSQIHNLLLDSINTDTTTQRLIKKGFNQEIDRLRNLIEHGAQEIFKLEKKEQERTGINSLKIRYNGAYGYSIEVTKANLNAIPNDYIRTQTLTNKERFTTQELKDLEYDLSRANNDIEEIEKEIFAQIKREVEKYLNHLKKLSYSLSYLDALISLSQVAYNNNYSRPEFNGQKEIVIENGRHPVIEFNLKEKFIPNSTTLNQEQTLWIITGPNMGGKSTYLRQVALVCIMAQIGSFVPAKNANLFILDRVFTRIGASDNLSEGKSTFLVEMEETALICNQATENSLVILDEVGRGTSTFDGLAIAQAVIEHIYNNIKARCLFATHYHELTELNKKFKDIVLYHAASTKSEDSIVLLHKILPGIAESSFGLEVAKLAQLPKGLINRAQEILDNLNNKNIKDNIY